MSCSCLGLFCSQTSVFPQRQGDDITPGQQWPPGSVTLRRDITLVIMCKACGSEAEDEREKGEERGGWGKALFGRQLVVL